MPEWYAVEERPGRHGLEYWIVEGSFKRPVTHGADGPVVHHVANVLNQEHETLLRSNLASQLVSVQNDLASLVRHGETMDRGDFAQWFEAMFDAQTDALRRLGLTDVVLVYPEDLEGGNGQADPEE